VLGTVAGIRAGALERLSVTEARSRFGDQTFWNGVIAIDTSRKARAGALERLSVTEARSRFGDQTFWNGVIAIDTSRKARAGAQERLSVTEARSRFGDILACSFDGELSDQNRPFWDYATT
jgi:hypothetical protein